MMLLAFAQNASQINEKVNQGEKMIIFFYSENDDKCKKMLNNLNLTTPLLFEN